MTGMDMVREKVLFFFRNNLYYGDADDEASADESLIDSGYIDSTGIISLVSYLEGAFDIKIHDSEIISENFETLNNILAYVGRKLGQGDPV